MKKVFIGCIGLMITFTFQGCSHIADLYYIDPIKYSDLDKTINLKQELINNNIISAKCDDSNINYHVIENNDTCRNQRNAAFVTLVLSSDALCMEHIASIGGNESALNLSFGTLTTALAGAATVSTVNTSKSILAGLATFSSAERSLVNDTIYKSVLAPVIIRKIRDDRVEKRKIFIKRIQEDNLTRMSFSMGLLDFIDYHNSCSFIFGLEKALKEGEQDSKKIKKQTLEEQLTILRSQRSLREYELNTTKSALVNDSDYNLTNQRIESIQQRLLELEKAE